MADGLAKWLDGFCRRDRGDERVMLRALKDAVTTGMWKVRASGNIVRDVQSTQGQTGRRSVYHECTEIQG